MNSILFIQSSPRGDYSCSAKVAQSIVNDLVARDPNVRVTRRNLAEDPLPHIGQELVAGMYLPPEQRTPEQAKAVAMSDALVDELSTAELLVLAVPMHNFSVPSTLKAWIDHVVRAGRTFHYSETGPVGLLNGKRAVLVLASGGVFSEGPAKPMDFQEPYLRTILGFIGITAVEVVRVEGVLMSSVGPEKAVASAKAQAKSLLAIVE